MKNFISSLDGTPNNESLYAGLSSIAALLGEAVSANRFHMLASSEACRNLNQLTRPQQALELWRQWFSNGLAQTVQLSMLGKESLPVLWLSPTDDRVVVLQSKLSNGAFAGLDELGVSVQIDPRDYPGCVALKLGLVGQKSGHEAQSLVTATDWFIFTLRKYKWAFIYAIWATLVVSLVGMVSALYTMQVYDRVIPTKGYSTLIVLTVGVLLSMSLELLLKLVRTKLVDRACKMIDQDLSAVFFSKALDIRMDARPRSVGTFAAQIRQFESVRTFMTASTLFVLADVPFALLFLLVIAYIGGAIVWVPLLTLPVSLLAGWLLTKPIGRYTAAHNAESNRKNGLLIDAIDGIESVKAANAEWKVLAQWRHLTHTIAGSELAIRNVSALTGYITQTFQQLSYIGLVAAGAYAVNQGGVTMGGLMACTMIAGRALTPVAQVPGLITQWKHAQVALSGLNTIMKSPSDRDPDDRLVVPQRCSGELQLRNVAFGYDASRQVLQVANLVFKPGDKVAVLGAVGSGKSTLVKILSGLYKPTAGVAMLDGIDMQHLAPGFIREHIGYLPQDVRLFQGTLRENLTLGLPTPSDTQILRAAALTGLDQVIQAQPKGLGLEISEGGRGLSGGQRQLVGLTRMLLAKPKVLLLDEPTASLDAQLESRVMRHLFEELGADATVVVVTHKPGFLALVNRVMVVERGQLVVDGPRDQVLAKLKGGAVVATEPANAIPEGGHREQT